MLMQVIANVLTAALVAHDHLVAALAAPGNPVQQCCAVARDAATLGEQVFGAVVAQHGLDLLERLPTYVSGITAVRLTAKCVAERADLTWCCGRKSVVSI
jgi:hypothetical protein